MHVSLGISVPQLESARQSSWQNYKVWFLLKCNSARHWCEVWESSAAAEGLFCFSEHTQNVNSYGGKKMACQNVNKPTILYTSFIDYPGSAAAISPQEEVTHWTVLVLINQTFYFFVLQLFQKWKQFFLSFLVAFEGSLDGGFFEDVMNRMFSDFGFYRFRKRRLNHRNIKFGNL